MNTAFAPDSPQQTPGDRLNRKRRNSMETRTVDTVNSVETLKAAIGQVREAQRIYAGFTQEQVDKIFLAAAMAGWRLKKPAWASWRIR